MLIFNILGLFHNFMWQRYKVSLKNEEIGAFYIN